MWQLLQQTKPEQLITLLTFYNYQTHFQDTKQIWCNDTFVAIGLKWNRGKVGKVRRRLIDLGEIEMIQRKDKNTGLFEKSYIKLVNPVWKMTTAVPEYHQR